MAKVSHTLNHSAVEAVFDSRSRLRSRLKLLRLQLLCYIEELATVNTDIYARFTHKIVQNYSSTRLFYISQILDGLPDFWPDYRIPCVGSASLLPQFLSLTTG